MIRHQAAPPTGRATTFRRPYRAAHRHLDGPGPPPSGQYRCVAIGERNGLHFERIRYWADVLPSIAQPRESLLLRYDPRDLSRVYLLTPNKSYQAVPYADVRRPPITLAELRFTDSPMHSCEKRPRARSMRSICSRCTSGKMPSSRTRPEPPRRRGVERNRVSRTQRRSKVRSIQSTTAKRRFRLIVNFGSLEHDIGSIAPHSAHPRASFSQCQNSYPAGSNLSLNCFLPILWQARKIQY
jgi:Mu transposase, C-terminal